MRARNAGSPSSISLVYPRLPAGQGTSLFEMAEVEEGADYHAALPWARRAAEAGGADAQAMFAYILTAGPEALRDPEAALNWYQKIRRAGLPAGAARLRHGANATRRYR